jgi:hypothetical protein
MQDLSFDFGDPFFDLAGWQASVQVVTFENLYGLDPARVTQRRNGDSFSLVADSLTWAGGQERSPGRVELTANGNADELTVTVAARHPQKIRCLKLLLRGLPTGDVIGARWSRAPLPPGGAILHYPASLHTPLIFIQAPHACYYFRSTDERVRAKRFALREAGGALAVELIHEDAAHEMTTSVTTPPWVVGRCPDPAPVVERHMTQVERALGLEPWETRVDVPDWARQVALVASIHGMHWTGHVFNTYAQILEALEWFTERIDGRRVLAFLPGWEGRYYWQYGDYRPEPRLGGRAGFRALVEGARRLGVKLMPMFGANCANAGLAGFQEWGAPSYLCSPGGYVFQGNMPDWDTSRANDPGWQAWLNPGAPAWRHHLLDQISRLVEEYELPAIFLDTQHIWVNDPQYPVFEGLLALRDALKARFPDLLVAGEGWYDALGAVTPVSQTGAPVQWPEIFARYNRTFGHLSWGDPSRASSGVHEAGTTGFFQAPNERHWWPTVTIVDGTLEKAGEAVEAVVAQAIEYARRFLS